MTRLSKGLVVMLVATLGMWGCARGPATSHAVSPERVRALEGKCAKLEEDYRAVAAARDQARKRLAALEEQHKRLQKDLVRERDELRGQVLVRTGERDALQMRCDRLKKGLQNLLGQDDALLPSANPPVTSAAAPTPGGRS